MNFIYHEKQEGSLCGQHCLNNLLQGEFYSAVDLATIAQEMDQAEQFHMAELGMDTEEFRHFLQQPSSNMDDSGMFSVQVLTSALKIWTLNLVPFKSTNPLSVAARCDPTIQRAYICNFKEHWFTVRKLGLQWFNLNSLLQFPELISDTYLSLFLTQLQHEGYCIFIVEGNLPPCQANEELEAKPAVQTIKPKLISESTDVKRLDEQDLQVALAASLVKAGRSGDKYSDDGPSSSTKYQSESDSDDINEDVRKAIELSMKVNNEGRSSERLSKSRSGSDIDEELHKALIMSLNEEQSPKKEEKETEDPDLDDIRRKRLVFLDKKHP